MRAFHRLSFYVTLLLMLGVIGAIWGASGFRAEARAVPVGVAVITLVVLLLILIGEFSPRFAAIFEISLESVAGAEGREAEELDPESQPDEVLLRDIPWRIAAIVFGSLIAFAVTILFFGFAVAIPLYVLLFLRLYGGAGWIRSIALAFGMTAVMILLSNVLRADLFRGLAFGAGMPPF